MGFFKSMFSFDGFMDRGEYWKAIILYILVPAIFMVFFAILSGMYNYETQTVILEIPENQPLVHWLTMILAVYEIIACTFCMMAVMAKRLRDISITPWMAFLYFIPPLAPFIILLFGMFPTNVNAYER